MNGEAGLSPLERFLREYAEAVGGMWEEVEPQVCDVLLPAPVVRGQGEEMLRLAFEPEALPEHPGSHLLIYGSPLLERIFAHARQQSRVSRVFLLGVNLSVPRIEAGVRGGLEVPPGSGWEIRRVRPTFFSHAAFWFQTTLVSDEKEQENYLNVVDLFYGRFARHLEEGLRHGEFSYSLGEERPFPLPDAPRISLAEAYGRARDRVVGTAAAAARAHRLELEQRLEQQVARMRRYYRDLAEELRERLERARRDSRVRPETIGSLEERLRGLAQEERVRVGELRQRSALRMHLRLLNLLLVVYPKFRIQAGLALEKGPPVELELVWDPVVGHLEPPPCPSCGQPTLRLEAAGRGRLACPACRGPGQASR